MGNTIYVFVAIVENYWQFWLNKVSYLIVYIVLKGAFSLILVLLQIHKSTKLVFQVDYALPGGKFHKIMLLNALKIGNNEFVNMIII